MKKFIFGFIFILLMSVATFATSITVGAKSFNNWTYGGTTAKIRFFLNQQIVTSTGEIYARGSVTSNNWYKEITCTVVTTVVSCPSFTIDSTTNSNVPTGTYAAYWFSVSGSISAKKEPVINDFRLPHNLGAVISWQQIATYNQSPAVTLPNTYYTAAQVNALLADVVLQEDIDQKVDTTDSRLEDDLSLYSNSLVSAVNALCPSGVCAGRRVLNVSRPVSTNTIVIPEAILLNVIGQGFITVNAGQMVSIGNFLSPGNRRVFDTSAAGASVKFLRGAVDKINIAWYVGIDDTAGNIDVTDALAEAVASTAPDIGGIIHFPNRKYKTSACHQLGDATTIEGEGNFALPGYGGTQLKLVTPSSTCVLKVGEGELGVRVKNILIDGTGTTGKAGILLEGSYPNSSGDLSIENVTISNFDKGLYYHSLSGSWQFAQIKITQTIFQNNTIGIWTNSLNSEFALESVNFAIPDGATSRAIYTNGIGIINIKSSEFAGSSGASSTTGNAIMEIDGAHVQINFIGCQDENINYFIINDASDITGIVNLWGNLIQSRMLINQSMTLNSQGNNWTPDGVVVAPGAQPSLSFINDVVRTDSGTIEAPGVIPANPLRIVKSADPITQLEWTNGRGTVGDPTGGAFTVRNYAKIQTPDYYQGAPTVPVLQVYHGVDGTSESKVLLRMGRADTNQTPEYYYDFIRQNSGSDAGRLKIQGNQIGVVGVDVNGDIYISGAVRNQTSALTDGATIFIDPRASNYYFVTLGGNRTLSIGTMTAFDQIRADGQKLTVELTQDGTGSRTLTLSSGAGQFSFGTDIPSITLTATAAKRDLLTVQYSARADRWFVVGFVKGF